MAANEKVARRASSSNSANSGSVEDLRKRVSCLATPGERPSEDVTMQERARLTLVDLIGSARGLYGTPEDVLAAREKLRREWP